MPKGFSSFKRGIARIDTGVQDGAIAGMRDGADILTNALQGTDAHGDDTGATRASYRAYTLGSNVDDSGAFADGYSAASALNPKQATQETVSGPPDGTVRVVTSSATTYQEYLENNNGGEHATIGPITEQHAGRVISGAFDRIKQGL